jgi:Pvc16 N-terminal domain
LKAALASLFDPNSGGTMVVSLNTPKEMTDNQAEGLSIWLYRAIRDEERLNAPPERISNNQLKTPPLPLRLHYLITPIVNSKTVTSPETEQTILGKGMQAFHDHAIFTGVDLQDDFTGTALELHVRLEPLSLEDTTRIYDAHEGPYRLSISYEVSVVYIYSTIEPESITPVQVVMPEYGVIV